MKKEILLKFFANVSTGNLCIRTRAVGDQHAQCAVSLRGVVDVERYWANIDFKYCRRDACRQEAQGERKK